MLFFIIFIISIILLILSLIVYGFIRRKYDKLCWLCWCDDENNNKYESKIIKLSKAVNCIDDIFLSGIIITDLVFICFIGCVIYSSNISGGKMELESSDKITPISSTSYYLEDDKYYYFNTSDETIEVPKNSVKMNIKYVESENARIEKYSTHIDENSVNPVFYISWVNDDKQFTTSIYQIMQKQMMWRSKNGENWNHRIS